MSSSFRISSAFERVQREETREINGDKRRDVRGKEGQPGRDKLPRTCVQAGDLSSLIFIIVSFS